MTDLLERQTDVTERVRALSSSLGLAYRRFNTATGSLAMTPTALANARSEVAVMAELLKSLRKELK